MALTKDKKKKITADYRRDKKDTGSPELQVALLTERINGLGNHFKAHVKDHHSRHGLLKMVSQRKRLLSYIQKIDAEKYKTLIARLDLRK